MPLSLYLDAARMGLMTPSAQLALQDFVRYQGENGCTLYFEQFLKDGWNAWSAESKRRFAGLHVWQGVRELAKSLRHVAAADDACRVLVASRTANLVSIATRVLFQNCRRVLLTDLTWPAYGRIAVRQASRLSGKITLLRLRRFIMEHKAAPEEVASQIAGAMQRRRCDGVLLPEVSHDGIRLPLQDLANTFREKNLTPMTVIDGAQAFAHVPIEQCLPTCDFYLAGSHKWLGAYLPLGIAFCPRQETRELFCHSSTKTDDPLLAFLQQMENRNKNRFSETVNLTPLFTCQAAITDLRRDDRSIVADLAARRANAATLLSALPGAWKPLLPADGFCCGILLLKAISSAFSMDEIRSRFLARGIALTAYEDGTLRLSMPNNPWTRVELQLLIAAFEGVATEAGVSCQSKPFLAAGAERVHSALAKPPVVGS